MKKYKLILSLLLILLIAGGVFATLGVIDIQKRGKMAVGQFQERYGTVQPLPE